MVKERYSPSQPYDDCNRNCIDERENQKISMRTSLEVLISFDLNTHNAEC